MSDSPTDRPTWAGDHWPRHFRQERSDSIVRGVDGTLAEHHDEQCLICERAQALREREVLEWALRSVAEYEDDHTTGPWPAVWTLLASLPSPEPTQQAKPEPLGTCSGWRTIDNHKKEPHPHYPRCIDWTAPPTQPEDG